MFLGRAGTFAYFFRTGFWGSFVFCVRLLRFFRPGPESSQTFYLCFLSPGRLGRQI